MMRGDAWDQRPSSVETSQGQRRNRIVAGGDPADLRHSPSFVSDPTPARDGKENVAARVVAEGAHRRANPRATFRHAASGSPGLPAFSAW